MDTPNRSCWTRRWAQERKFKIAFVAVVVIAVIIVIFAIFSKINDNEAITFEKEQYQLFPRNKTKISDKNITLGKEHDQLPQRNKTEINDEDTTLGKEQDQLPQRNKTEINDEDTTLGKEQDQLPQRNKTEAKCEVVDDNNICNTPQCVALSQRLSQRMDQRVDPCDNFYKYACGEWKDTNTIDDNTIHSSYSSEPFERVNNELKTLLEIKEEEVSPADDLTAFKKARQFYRSCMLETVIETRGFQPAKKLLDTIGTIYDKDSFGTGKLDITDLFYQLLIRNGAPFFDVDTCVDPEYYITIFSPGSSAISGLSNHNYRVLMHRSMFEAGLMSTESSIANEKDATIDGSLLHKYMRMSINKKIDDKMFNMLQSYFQREANDSKQMALEKELKNFITELRDVFPTFMKLRKADEEKETYVTYTIDELQTLFEEINWKMLLEKLCQRTLENDQKIVAVSYPPYLKDLQKLFRKFGPWVINNAALALYSRDVLWELMDAKKGVNRWKYCVHATKKAIPRVLSAMYVRSFPREHLVRIESKISDVFGNIKRSFQTVMNSSWMDSVSKEKIADKIEGMNFSVMIDDAVYNNTSLEMSVKNFTIYERGFFENVISAYQLSRLKSHDISNITESKSEKLIEGYSYDVNAFYYFKFNAVALTLGILSPHIHFLDEPKYITYGKIGCVIGHEIAHGFDPDGIHYDENGNYKETWLSFWTRWLYRIKLDCFRKVYKTAKVEFLGREEAVQVNGNRTLDEFMADNAGIDISFQAYQSLENQSRSDGRLPGLNLTQGQWFFLSTANYYCATMTPMRYLISLETSTHSPAPDRLNALLMHSDKFAEEFHCPLGSPMNPKSKCRMW